MFDPCQCHFALKPEYRCKHVFGYRVQITVELGFVVHEGYCQKGQLGNYRHVFQMMAPTRRSEIITLFLRIVPLTKLTG